jgi:hypothetical protein
MISHSTKHYARSSLTHMLNAIEWQITYAKAKVAYHWERSDKARPMDTGYHFHELNLWKNDLRKSRKNASQIRKALKELK